MLSPLEIKYAWLQLCSSQSPCTMHVSIVLFKNNAPILPCIFNFALPNLFMINLFSGHRVQNGCWGSARHRDGNFNCPAERWALRKGLLLPFECWHSSWLGKPSPSSARNCGYCWQNREPARLPYPCMKLPQRGKAQKGFLERGCFL